MVFIQYYEKSPVDGSLIEPCGDRSVVIIDGRNSLANMKADAVSFNGHRRPEYAAYRIFKGESFNRGLRALTDIIKL